MKLKVDQFYYTNAGNLVRINRISADGEVVSGEVLTHEQLISFDADGKCREDELGEEYDLDEEILPRTRRTK